jgi:DNA-binding response OmpR family regulator
MRILLIEDHERFSKFVIDGLEKEGFTVDGVDTAGAGEDAKATVQ